MRRRSLELLYAALAMALIAAAYAVVVARWESFPAASGLFGHGLGIAGFLLMLMTETLYSLRKRSRSARWGRNATWLRFHIFTGLVGPFMVLLHTSWKFNGLAGVVALLTALVVISGFVGRYIYTAVPRTADGVALEAADLEIQIAEAETELQRWLADRPDSEQALAHRLEAISVLPEGGLLLVLGRPFLELGVRLRWWREQRRLGPQTRSQAGELNRLVRRRRMLRRQVASLALARRMLATWHAVHIPIGMVLFVAAFVHVGAALYYATLLK
jgi:hypothetical protein